MASPSDGDAPVYKVILTDVAEAEQEAALLWMAQRSPAAARRLLGQMDRALGLLSWSPRAGVVAPDEDAYDVEVRQVSFGAGKSRFRALYHVLEEDRIVRVLHIRHSAQRLLTDKPDEDDAR